MNNMTNFKARRKGKKELADIFNSLKFQDGLSDENITAANFAYYYNKARNGQKGNYIIYETVESNPAVRADDVVCGREYFAQIDIFSVYSFETKKLCDVILGIEEKLTEKMFEVDMKEELYESDTGLYHQILYVSKTYYY